MGRGRGGRRPAGVEVHWASASVRMPIDANEQWGASGARDNTVGLWDLAGEFPADEVRHPDCLAAVCFIRDGEYLVVGCDDMYLYVYRLR